MARPHAAATAPEGPETTKHYDGSFTYAATNVEGPWHLPLASVDAYRTLANWYGACRVNLVL